MVKESNIILRVEGSVKQRIADAARRRGKNLTTFVLEATMRQVEKIESSVPRTDRGAFPTFFRALCVTATAGGSDGYAAAGYQLTGAIAGEQPYDLDDEEWGRRLDELEDLLKARHGSDEQILAWFDVNVPRCMAIVPKRRRGAFAGGVRRCYDESGLDR